MSLPAVNRMTMREQVVQQLRAGILDGAFRPGDKLAETELAARFGVSRGTVREALRTLHEGGLLTGAERNSLYVRELTTKEIYDLYEVRAALEGQAVAAILSSPDRDAMVDDLEKRLPESGPEAGHIERFEEDLGFHEALCRFSGNAMLLSFWTSLKDLMRITVIARHDESLSLTLGKAYHQPIIDAMRSGDPEEARAALVRHMQTAAAAWGGRPDAQ